MPPRIRTSSDGSLSASSGDGGVSAALPTTTGHGIGGVAPAAATISTSLSIPGSDLLKSYFITINNGAISKKKAALMIFLAFLVVSLLVFVTLYICHRGFRRTINFWTRAIPWIVEYYALKFHSHWIANHTETEWDQIRTNYHFKAAPKVVEAVQEMGGIYVKIGQALSTMGSGLLPEEYVQAMRPLQDGIPPRDYDTISRIIEKSTGRKMKDIFHNFEKKPIGAATIGQAHRAILKTENDDDDDDNNKQKKKQHRQVVVVKVQYPEVEELFDADLNNLEWLSWLVLPDRSQDLLKNIRERHEREMDFRIEAQHLRDCSANMRKHGLEPALVRIPKVMNETGICTKNVLVMEYLEGVSLRDVMEEEQDRIARALGKANGEELRFTIAKRIKEHFDQGGGAGDSEGETQMKLLGGGGGGGGSKRGGAGFVWNALGPFAIHGLRRYARIRDQLVQLTSVLRRNNNQKNGEMTSFEAKLSKSRHIDLGKVLKTVIRAHAIQVMMDGLYNCDPHPGNILVLEDGRVGLLDYGMVGHLDDRQRLRVASTVYNLAHHNPQEVANLYLEDGYHITYEGDKVEDPQILYRISSTHFNKFDLTPVTVGANSRFKHDGSGKVGVIELFEKMDVIFIPDWIIQARRVGRLLMGVSAQAARPISLAKEWEPIAKRAIREMKERENKRRAPARI